MQTTPWCRVGKTRRPVRHAPVRCNAKRYVRHATLKFGATADGALSSVIIRNNVRLHLTSIPLNTTRRKKLRRSPGGIVKAPIADHVLLQEVRSKLSWDALLSCGFEDESGSQRQVSRLKHAGSRRRRITDKKNRRGFRSKSAPVSLEECSIRCRSTVRA